MYEQLGGSVDQKYPYRGKLINLPLTMLKSEVITKQRYLAGR